MKNLKADKKTGAVATALIMMAVGFAQLPFMGKASPLKDPSRAEERASRGSDRARLDEKLDTRANVAAAARKLNISQEVLHDFLNNQVRDRESVSTLLSEIMSSEKSKNADEVAAGMVAAEIFSSYVKMRRSGLPDAFHITEGDLLDIHRSWTPTQKSNFERVLRRAAEIAKTTRAISLNEAFELSLKENGLLDAYRRGCSAG